MVGLRDGSALFAVVGQRDAAARTLAGLQAQRHRGSAGLQVVVATGTGLRETRGADAVHDGIVTGQLEGRAALGQVFGHGDAVGAPLVRGRYRGGVIAVAVSGRFTNGTRLRRELGERGALFRSTSDAEVLAHLIAQSSKRTFVNRLVDALWKVRGAFCAAVLTEDQLVAVRDPHGFRPLLLGRAGEAWLVSTEDAAIWATGGAGAREIEPGELVIVDRSGCERVKPFLPRPTRACGQELTTLARPDARVFGHDVHSVRRGLGERLALEHPPPSDAVVVALARTGETFALGYARAAGCAFEPALHRGVDAVSIDGPGRARPGGARRAWHVVGAAVEGRTVVLVVPTVVTGVDVTAAAAALRRAGATRVVLRGAAPPVRHACVYGVASPTTDELAVPWARDGAALARALGVDEARFLSLDGLRDLLGRRADGASAHCLACWTGEQPVPPEEPDDQLPLF